MYELSNDDRLKLKEIMENLYDADEHEMGDQIFAVLKRLRRS